MEKADRIRVAQAFHDECVRGLKAAGELEIAASPDREDEIVADRLGIPLPEYARDRRHPPDLETVWEWLATWRKFTLPGHSGRTEATARRWALKRALGHDVAWRMIPGKNGHIPPETGPLGRPRVTGQRDPEVPVFGVARLNAKQRRMLDALIDSILGGGE